MTPTGTNDYAVLSDAVASLGLIRDSHVLSGVTRWMTDPEGHGAIVDFDLCDCTVNVSPGMDHPVRRAAIERYGQTRGLGWVDETVDDAVDLVRLLLAPEQIDAAGWERLAGSDDPTTLAFVALGPAAPDHIRAMLALALV